MTAPQPHVERHRGVPGWVPVALIVGIVALDFITKRVAVASLMPRGIPHRVMGDVVRFTLAFNPGVAFGMHLGGASRFVFSLLTLAILAVLAQLYWSSHPTDRLRRIAIALVAGGAIGNLIDRLRWSQGVVDFIDIGIGDVRFWTFNVADMAVSMGAILLIWVLQREDHLKHKEAKAAAAGLTAPEPLAVVRDDSADRGIME